MHKQVDAHVEERLTAVLDAVGGERENLDRRVQQQVGQILQIGSDQNADVLAHDVIVDTGKFRHLQQFLGRLRVVRDLPE